MVSEVAQSVRGVIAYRAAQTVGIIVRIKDEIVAFDVRVEFLKSNMLTSYLITGLYDKKRLYADLMLALFVLRRAAGGVLLGRRVMLLLLLVLLLLLMMISRRGT